MPTLNWIGKDKVVNHASAVPFHVLEHVYNFGGESENKIIHGDNLLALKSLLPEYERRIKCIYIDPPYNTGNEGWVYNDKVNSPQIKKWLGEVVGKEGEDLSRHDKWLCMMYPRLKLLKKLLADDGAIFISIDDNEQANLKLICDEIFGAQNFLAELIWNLGTGTTAGHFTRDHEIIFCYAKNKDILPNFKNFNDEENIVHGALKKISRKNPPIEITFPAGFEFDGNNAVFSGEIGNSEKEFILSNEMRFKGGKLVADTKIRAGFAMRNQVESFIRGEEVFDSKGQRVKRFFFNKSGILFYEKEKTIINPKCVLSDFGSTKNGTSELFAILGKTFFDFPKPVKLIQFFIQLATDKDSIVLDSFAGSGTTAHAVLNLNAQDGGNRKFILAEMEDYADTITAERVRRVIKGYGQTAGTGGSFDFYEIGEPLMIQGNLNENIDVEKIRAYIWYTETHTPYKKPSSTNSAYLGDFNGTAYYFHYERDRHTTLDAAFLRTIEKHANNYLIYADECGLDETFLQRNSITFKKISRDIKKIWSDEL